MEFFGEGLEAALEGEGAARSSANVSRGSEPRAETEGSG